MKSMLVAASLLAGAAWSATEEAYEPDQNTVLLLHADGRGNDVAMDSSRSQLAVRLLESPRRPTWEQEGMFGGCLRFDGTNEDEDGDGRGDADALWLDDEGKLQPTSGLTVEAWIRPDRVSGKQAIVSRSGGGRYCLFLYDGALYFSMQMATTGPARWERLLVPNLVKEGVWQHIAVTFDGKPIGGYLNACEEGIEDVVGVPTDGKAVTVIGCDTDSRPGGSTIRGFRGLIDELRISNRARTSFKVSERRTAAVKPSSRREATSLSTSTGRSTMVPNLQPAPSPVLPDKPK